LVRIEIWECKKLLNFLNKVRANPLFQILFLKNIIVFEFDVVGIYNLLKFSGVVVLVIVLELDKATLLI